MYLFIITSVLSFISSNTSLVEVSLLKLVNRKTSKELSLLSKKLELRRQQSSIPMVDNFAKYAKIQRQINAIDQELDIIVQQKNEKAFVTKLISSYGVKFVIAVVLFLLSYYYRYFPILFLDKKYNLFPFSSIISYPNEPNTVSVHFWIICCSTVARLIKT